jgi:hypothetical protein
VQKTRTGKEKTRQAEKGGRKRSVGKKPHIDIGGHARKAKKKAKKAKKAKKKARRKKSETGKRNETTK